MHDERRVSDQRCQAPPDLPHEAGDDRNHDNLDPVHRRLEVSSYLHAGRDADVRQVLAVFAILRDAGGDLRPLVQRRT